MEGPNLAAKNDHHIVTLSDTVGAALACPVVSAVPSLAPGPGKAQCLGMCWLWETWAWRVLVRDSDFSRGLMPAMGRPEDCQPDPPRGLSVALGCCGARPPSERRGRGEATENQRSKGRGHSRLVFYKLVSEPCSTAPTGSPGRRSLSAQTSEEGAGPHLLLSSVSENRQPFKTPP